MKRLIHLILIVMIALPAIPLFAEAKTIDGNLIAAQWQNAEDSLRIRNGESASFYYRLPLSDVAIDVSIDLKDSNNNLVKNIIKEKISEKDLLEQGLRYTSDVITINPSDYNNAVGDYKVIMAINTKDAETTKKFSREILYLEVTGQTDNKAPVAIIEVFPSSTVKPGTPVTLSGLKSYDEDGSIVEYQWSQLSGVEAFQYKPKESAIIITPTKEGFFTFLLKVKDNEGVESPIAVQEIRVTDTIITENSAPIANAGPDQTVETNTLVTLDGSLSYDPDGDEISHSWRQIEGSGITIVGSTTANPTFSAYHTGKYVFELEVRDIKGKTSSDQVEITVLESVTNRVPIASFIAPSEAKVGELVRFDASNSYDPDGSIVEYKWETDGKTFFGKVASYVFTVAKEFIVKLTVTDDKGATSTLEKVINIKDSYPGENLAPIANAGFDQSVSINSVVTLDGSLSYDSNGDKISYSWTQIEGSLVSLDDSATKNPRFTAKIPGRYKFSLTVIDDKGLSSLPDEVVITVLEDGQIPPPEEVSRDIHKFTVTSAFVQENEGRLDVYAKVRNRGDNREDVILSATILPTGEYASTRTIAEIKESSYEVLSLNKPQESGSYIIKIDVSNRRDRDVYYFPLEV